MLSRLRLFTLGLLLSATCALGVEVNQVAPGFTLNNLRGETTSLAEGKGNVRFVNFWASWCGPCQVELPELNRLAKDYKGQKVQVLAINVDQERSEARKALARLGLRSPSLDVLWDSQSKVVSRYDVEAMPSSFLIDAQGVIRYSHSGFKADDPARWREEINALLR